MARMSLYLPDELKARMEHERPDENWAQVFRGAVLDLLNPSPGAGADPSSGSGRRVAQDLDDASPAGETDASDLQADDE